MGYRFTIGPRHVSNVHSPSDVAGVYAAGNIDAAVGRGAQAVVLTSRRGAILSLSGSSVGAIVSADLNDLAITLKKAAGRLKAGGQVSK